MNKKLSIVSVAVICCCFSGHAGIFSGNVPNVAFPEVRSELQIQKAPVVAVMREKKQDFQVASNGNVALNYNKNRLYVNKPNLKYVSDGEEIVVPMPSVAVGKVEKANPVISSKNNFVKMVKTEKVQDKKIAETAKVDTDKVAKMAVVENELVLRQKELEAIKIQIAESEARLKSMKKDVELPVVEKSNKKVEEVAEKEQVVLPYKLAKSVENPIVAKKKIEYPKDVKKEFEKVYMAENEYLTLLESDFDEENIEDDGSLNAVAEKDFDEYFPEEAIGTSQTGSGIALGGDDSNVIVENANILNNLNAFSQESVSTSILDKKINILQMKIGFEENGSSVNNKNIELISSFASVVMNNPTNGVEIYISDQSLADSQSKKLMAKRLAVVSQVLKDQGLKEFQIKPVLSKRPYNSMVLKIVDLDLYKQKKNQKTDVFGNVIKDNAYRSIDW